MKLDGILLYQGYYIGGSYIVNKETANDIDVVFHEYKHDDDIRHSLVRNGFFALQKGDRRYDELDNKRIIAIYAGKIGETKVNIIVVGACFWPAYIGAINEMAAWPDLYQDRSQRIALHKALCRDIAKMTNIDISEAGL